jgi:hypothetical protein
LIQARARATFDPSEVAPIEHLRGRENGTSLISTVREGKELQEAEKLSGTVYGPAGK